MSLSSGASKLSLGLKTLELQWDEAKSKWNDPVSRSFEESHLRPLEAQVVATIRAIDQLGLTLARVRQECG